MNIQGCQILKNECKKILLFKTFYEQFAQTQQAETPTIWNKLPWNKSQKIAQTINKGKASENLEVNQSLNSSQVSLLNKVQGVELQDLGNEQQAQIVQQQPFGIPGSSK